MKDPLKKLLFTLVLCLTVFWSFKASAQLDDLIIVEYIDDASGAGFGITIHNPTNRSITLSGYTLGVYNNGNTTGDETVLQGTIAPGGFFKVGNSPHCGTTCRTQGGCDQTVSSVGVNGDDCIALFRTGSNPKQFVDMINRFGDQVAPRFANNNGGANALFQSRIFRNANNCVRYTSTTGTGANSWPGNTTTIVAGWVWGDASQPANRCLQVNSSPFNTISDLLPANASFCGTSNVTISPNPGLQPGTTYLWSTGANTSTITVNSAGKVWLTINAATCPVTDTIEVTGVTKPNLGLDRNICKGDTIELRSSTPVSAPSWNTGEATPSIKAVGGRTYWVRSTSGTCVTSDTVVIGLFSAPNFSLGADLQICKGDSVRLFVPSGNFTQPIWSTSATGNSIWVKTAGQVRLAMRDDNNCTVRDTLIVSFRQNPVLSLGRDTSICDYAALRLTVPAGFTNPVWSDGSTNSQLRIIRAGSYTLKATAPNGCVLTDTIVVTNQACEAFVPNYFSPNASSTFNKTWKLSGTFLSEVDVVVYNRWGRRVFSATKPDFEWDGASYPAGTYFYYLKGKRNSGEDVQFEGWLELAR